MEAIQIQDKNIIRITGILEQMNELQSRLSEVYPNDIQKIVYKMVEKGDIETQGAKRNRKYFVQKKTNRK